MSFSPKVLITQAAKDVSHKRARWIKIDDKKNSTRRYELVYIIGRVKGQRDHVIIRRMNDKEDPTRFSVKNALKKPPSKCMYSGQDIIWFLKWGFRSFIQYQVHHQDDASGAVLQATNAPVIDLDERNLLKNYKAKLLRQDQEIADLHKKLEKVSSPKQKQCPQITVQSQNNNNHNYFKPKTKNVNVVTTPMEFLGQKNMLSRSTSNEPLINTSNIKSDYKSYEDLINKMKKQHEEKLLQKDKQIVFHVQTASNSKQKCKELQSQLTNTENKRDELQLQITDLTAKNMELEGFKQQITMLQRQNANTERENKQLLQELESKKGIICKKDKLIATLVNDAEHKRKIDADLLQTAPNKDIDTKQQLIAQYEEENQRLCRKYKDLEYTFSAQINKLKKAEDIENDLNAQLYELQQQLNDERRKHKQETETASDDANKGQLIDVLTKKISEVEAERDKLLKILNEKHEAQNKKDDELQQKYQEIEFEYSYAKKRSETLQKEVNELQAKLDSTERVLKEKEGLIQSTLQEKNELESQATNKDTKIHQMKQNQVLQRKQTECLIQDHELNTMDKSQTIADLQADVNEWKTAHKSLDEQYKLEVEQLSNTIKDHEEKIDHLTAKTIDLNDLNATYKDSIQSMNAQIERKERNFKSGMNKLNEKLRNSKIRNTQQEDSLHNLTQRLRSANDEITKQKQEIKVIQKQQEETQRNYTQIYVQHEEMQGQKEEALNDLKKFEKRYQTEVAQKQSVIDGLRDTCKELKQTKDALKRHNTSLTQANTRMSELRQEDQQQIEQVETLRQQNEELKQDNDEFKQELLMMNVEDKDNEVLNDLRHKIAEYEQSITMLKTQHKQEITALEEHNRQKDEMPLALAAAPVEVADALEEDNRQKDDIPLALAAAPKVADGDMMEEDEDEVDDDEAEEEIVIQKMSKETLEKKYRILKNHNQTLQTRIMQLVSPSEDKSEFPVIEDIRGEFGTLRKQYCTDLFDELTGEICDQYEELWGEQEIDDEDAIYDREARRVLFDLLHITYHFIRVYKREKFEDIIDSVAIKFELKTKKAKEAMSRSMGMVMTPYFQHYYELFSRHRYIRDDGKNNKNGELMKSDINKIIDEIYGFIQKLYSDFNFWNKKAIEKRFKIYIAKTCELCWIMVLNTPQLYFFPRLFTLNDGNVSRQQYDEHVKIIYDQELTTKVADGDAETAPIKDIQKKKKKKKKKGKKDKKEDEEKDEEKEMDKIVKEHEVDTFDCKLFDDKFHDCLNEAEDVDDDDDDDMNHNNIINHNGMHIAYCGWPSLIRTPQLESEQHTQITKTFAYCHRQPKQFMDTILPQAN